MEEEPTVQGGYMGEVNLGVFDERQRTSPYAANRLLFGWLSDDAQRVRLYQCLKQRQVLKFQSRAKLEMPPPQPPKFQQDVFLVTSRKLVEEALCERRNAPYAALGSGTFLLGLDKG